MSSRSSSEPPPTPGATGGVLLGGETPSPDPSPDSPANLNGLADAKADDARGEPPPG